VAYVSAASGQGELWVVPVEGGAPSRVAQDLKTDYVWWPTWSADGKWLYFPSGRSGDNGLWRVPSTGGEPDLVAPGSSSWHGFSRDRTTVYLAREDGARRLLYAMPLDGGPERLVAELDARPGVFGGIRAVDDHALYFTWHQDFSDIWVMDIVEGDD
jgi:TolB protein